MRVRRSIKRHAEYVRTSVVVFMFMFAFILMFMIMFVFVFVFVTVPNEEIDK